MNALTLFLNPFSRCAQQDIMAKHSGDRVEERVYKALWHVAIAGVGVYEYRHHKSLLSKILSAGLIAFHLDGAVADALDIPPLSRRILSFIRPHDSNPENSTG